MSLKFTIHNTVGDQYYFNLKHEDGRKLLTSRNYRNLTACSNEIYRLQQYRDFELEDEPQMEICCYRFALRLKSGRVIAKSPRYDSLNEMRYEKRLINSDLIRACIEDHSASIRFFRKAPKLN